MGIVADGTVAHGGEHDRHGQFQLGRQFASDISVLIPGDPIRLLTEEHSGFHRLTKRINGRIGHLGGVNEDFIPIHGKFLWIAHGGQQYTTGGRLFVDFLDRIVLPVSIFTQGAVTLDDFQRSCGTQRHTTLTVDTFSFIAQYAALFWVKAVNFIGTLALTNPAGDAAAVISYDFKFRINKIHTHTTTPSFTLMITGSPPAGAQIFSASGAMVRMAASSLAM